MQLGIIGLGRMGGNIARRLMLNGHTTVVFDRNTDSSARWKRRARPALPICLPWSLACKSRVLSGSCYRRASPPKTTIDDLSELMERGDVIIDGGNTFYKDDVRRGKALAEKGLHYIDVGTSGGVWGLERGYCMMIGGDAETVKHLDPIFATLAPGLGDIPRTKDRTADRRPRRTWLYPRRPCRFRALREDDPQRHRVRHDAGVMPKALTFSRPRTRKTCRQNSVLT
jgi:6-phosphogluconate dehydrogenase